MATANIRHGYKDRMIEIWCKMWCDKCDSINWFGDYDYIEGFVCHKCKTPNFLIQEELLRKMGIGNDPEVFEDGLEKPS